MLDVWLFGATGWKWQGKGEWWKATHRQKLCWDGVEEKYASLSSIYWEISLSGFHLHLFMNWQITRHHFPSSPQSFCFFIYYFFWMCLWFCYNLQLKNTTPFSSIFFILLINKTFKCKKVMYRSVTPEKSLSVTHASLSCVYTTCFFFLPIFVYFL